MRKGVYNSQLGRDFVVTIRVAHDMSDAEFQYALERAMGEPLADTDQVVTKLMEG